MTITPDQLTQSVNFRSNIGTQDLSFNADTGFMYLADNQNIHVGFATPYDSQRGGYDSVTQFVKPITELEDVPKEFRTAQLQGKGVGPRVFNTLEAAHSLPGLPDRIGLYAFRIQPDKLSDFRQAQGGRLTHIVRHAARIARTKSTSNGLENVVDAIHRGQHYWNYDAVQLNVPARAEARMTVQNRLQMPTGLRASFMIIRSADVILEKIGDAPKLK